MSIGRTYSNDIDQENKLISTYVVVNSEWSKS